MMPTRSIGRAALWFLAGVAVSLSLAEPQRSELFETATVWARPLSTATSAVTVVDRQAIDDLNVQSVAELMRFVPGMDVTSNGPRGGVATAQTRGGDPNFTVVLLDGVPLNDATDQFGGSVNLNSLPVHHVERIEVVRGPQSSSFGSSALAGAVNIITRRGESDVPRLDFDVTAGNDSVLQGAASVSRRSGKRDYFVGASWDEAEDQVADDAFEQFNLQGNVRFELDGDSVLRLTGRVTSGESEDYPDASGGPRFGTGETRNTDYDETSVGVELRLGQAERQHKVYATAYRRDLERKSPAVPPHPTDPFNFVPPIVEETDYTNTQAGWSYPVLQRTEGRLSVGAEIDWEKGDNRSMLFLAPGFVVDGSYDNERTTGGLFAEWIAGGDRVQYELVARTDLTEDFGTEVSPRAGISVRLPNDATRVRATVSRAFKLPSFFALASPAAIGGNPDLDPETALGGDVGLDHEFAATNVTASLAVFYYRFEDLIDFDFATFSLVNRSEVRTRGAELSLAWSPAGPVSVHGNLAYQDVENRETGASLLNRPEWVGGGRVVWQVCDRARWDVDAQTVSERLDSQIPVPERAVAAGYTAYGTAATFDVAEGWQLHARVDNLTDKDHDTLIGFPGVGRSFRLGLRHRSR